MEKTYLYQWYDFRIFKKNFEVKDLNILSAGLTREKEDLTSPAVLYIEDNKNITSKYENRLDIVLKIKKRGSIFGIRGGSYDTLEYDGSKIIPKELSKLRFIMGGEDDIWFSEIDLKFQEYDIINKVFSKWRTEKDNLAKFNYGSQHKYGPIEYTLSRRYPDIKTSYYEYKDGKRITKLPKEKFGNNVIEINDSRIISNETTYMSDFPIKQKVTLKPRRWLRPGSKYRRIINLENKSMDIGFEFYHFSEWIPVSRRYKMTESQMSTLMKFMRYERDGRFKGTELEALI